MQQGETESLDFTFERKGTPVTVRVELRVNDDPAALGCPECARGFPVMRATVAPPARGYQDALGWIQLVQGAPEGDGDGFSVDIFEALNKVEHPFGYFGFAPTSFDAPHRDSPADLDWVAHTFLAGVAEIYRPSTISAALGFSWGYSIRDREVSVTGLDKLDAAAWDDHLPLLHARYSDWKFAPDYSLA